MDSVISVFSWNSVVFLFNKSAGEIETLFNFTYGGIHVGKGIVALLIFGAFLVIRKFFCSVVLRQIEKWIQQARPDVQRRVLLELEAPLRFVPVVLGAYFSFKYLNITDTYVAQHVLQSLILFNIFWGLFNLAHPLSLVLIKSNMLSPMVILWATRALRFAIAIIGAAAILESWGIKVGPIIAGLGLLGMAVALGAQDIFKNIIAGLSILAERRFNIGDIIRLSNEVEGIVENIGFRSTLIRRFDNAPLYLPNSHLADGVVTNFSARDHRCIDWRIHLHHHTSLQQLKKVRDAIEGYVITSGDFATDLGIHPEITIEGFEPSAITLRMHCFTKTKIWGEFLKVQERLTYRVKDIIEKAGTSLAIPIQALHFSERDGAAATTLRGMSSRTLRVKKKTLKKPKRALKPKKKITPLPKAPVRKDKRR